MLKLFFCLRYLRKKKIVLLSIGAVALSTALLIVVSSLFIGFINAFEQTAVDTIGDVILIAPMRFPKYSQLIEQLQQSHVVKAATATLVNEGLLYLGKGNVRRVNVVGIEPASYSDVTAYKKTLLKQKDSATSPTFETGGATGADGGFVGIAVVAEPDEETDEYDFAAIEKMIGQAVVLTTGAAKQAGTSDLAATQQFIRRTVKLTIADIVFTGVYDLDKALVYLPRQRLQDILYPDANGPIADRLQIKLAEDASEESALAQIRGIWSTFASEQLEWSPYNIDQTTITTAKQMQYRYVAALYKQMRILLLIFGIVSLSVIMLVFCIFYMIVLFKQRDIAVMKSCGAASGSIACIFVGFGASVGIIGSVLGAASGYLITKNINTIEEWIRIVFGLKLWKSSVYIFSQIPNQVDWVSCGKIIALAIAAAIVGTFIPAIVAARTRPVEILRYE